MPLPLARERRRRAERRLAELRAAGDALDARECAPPRPRAAPQTVAAPSVCVRVCVLAFARLRACGVCVRRDCVCACVLVCARARARVNACVCLCDVDAHLLARKRCVCREGGLLCVSCVCERACERACVRA